MMHARLVAGILAIFLAATPSRAGTKPEVVRAIDRILRDAESKGFSGVVILRRKDALLFRAAYGPGSCDRSGKLSIDSVFDIGSITKVFTGAAILRAAHDGLISLDAPLRDFFDDVPPDKREITIGQLLQHTSGLADSLGEDECLIGREFFLRKAFAQPLVSKPGERKSYSNTGFSILAAILEKRSGLDYEEYLRAKVVIPTGARVAYSWGARPKEKFACGFREGLAWGSTRDYFSPKGPSWYLMGNGGLLASALDLDRWLDELLAGRILDPASTQMVADALSSTDKSGRRTVAVGGSNLIFTSQYLRWPEGEVTLLLFTSTAEWPKERILPALREAITPLLASPPASHPR